MNDLSPTHVEVIAENEEFIIAIIPPFVLDSVWSGVQVKLEEDPELWNHAHTINSMRAALESQQMKLWIVVRNGTIHMYFFTTITHYPVCSLLDVVWASGTDLMKYIGLGLSGIEAHAKFQGCSGVTVSAARTGWEKPLSPFGYKKMTTTFVKMLSNERLS